MFNDFHKDDPEWTPEQCNMKNGDTTFKQCGWCEHRGSGSYRYDCMISGDCTLAKMYGNFHNVKWDTLCNIIKLGKDDLQSIIESKNYEITEHNNGISSVEEEISKLRELFEKAEWKPALPDSRHYDYCEGEKIWIFYEDKWCSGIVVPGYRSHDGCVSYILDDFPESKPGAKGPWGCGVAVPGILKEKEYNYFKAVPKRFLEWSKLCDRSYNGEKMPMDAMYRALC